MHQLTEALQQWWLALTWPEIVAVITGSACVYLAAINNIWNWPIAIISTVISVYVMAKTGFYADMLQYCYLTVINVYGWVIWTKRKGDDKRPIVRISRKQIIWSIVAVVMISPILGFTLIKFSAALKYNPPAYPYLDSFCTVVSLAAQVLMARKVLENWLIWVFVDIVYVGIYGTKGVLAFAFMFFIYTIVAAWGYVDWHRIYLKQAKRA
ncbi:nicotinamide riboside transporter PnuC [Mucilaginibacter myungsuensis]|uniref:Nicotinamide riboside transporter PnuC n=1 Tax=Mucilaginibacter myungsuensis TaxID=649104 RepID=A0A929KUA9_9SPHI|nr:nicotinamide riboside transporter PnuC [Mucilaginibacter myungsuensis]MBE9661317.1 nicotinamide mononucleotide transporter [Mucilaginibacter myungsuensis]MDN3597460.1 nicotinamide riboside transporter PnuC [Mucilaginibacter myungsuensis]